MVKVDTDRIEALLGHRFSQKHLLQLAFVHSSFFNENREEMSGHNERLEFLGDAVLGLITSEYLYRHLPSQAEGQLSHLRAHLVGAAACAGYTRSLNLESYLLLGRGELENTGRGRDRLLADLFEAVIGAIYLDGGLVAAQEFFLRHFARHLDQAVENPLRNWKAELQHYSQQKTQQPPEYVVIDEIGPSHQRVFTVAVLIEGKERGRGEGPSKKQAEQDAAENALRAVERERDDGED